MYQAFFKSKNELRFGKRLGSRLSSSCWIRSSAEEEEEEEKFCWVWRDKLTILVALREMFLLADLLIAAEIWPSSCDDNLVRFIVIGSGRAVDAGYSYVNNYLSTAVRIKN